MFIRCGNDLLSHVLRRSTISAAALNGRVRDGIGCFARAMITTPKKHNTGGSTHVFPPRGRARLQSKSAATQSNTACFHRSHQRRSVFMDRRRSSSSTTDVVVCIHLDLVSISFASTGSNQAYRAISTGQLNTLLRLHLRPIDEVVYLGPQGYLVLRGASRLDAFSGYPVRS